MEEKCPHCGSNNIKGLPRAHYAPEYNPLENMNRAPDRYKCNECDQEWRTKK